MAPVIRTDWFPDWSGQYCAIIASGPSAKKVGVESLRYRIKVVAIKESSELVPFADVIYGCDGAWWKNVNGLPAFQGLKVAYEPYLGTRYPDIRFIDIDKKSDDILTSQPGLIGSGGNSGFHALNLVVQWGVRGVLLVGFDMHDKNGLHWYGRNNGPGRSNPNEDNFRRWKGAFTQSAGELDRLGVDVVDASDGGALKCFRKATIEEALAGWNL